MEEEEELDMLSQSLTADWHQIFEEFQDNDKLIEETFELIVTKHVYYLNFSDRSEYRAKNQYPDSNNDPKFEQKKLSETRNIKIKLVS